MIEPVDRLCDGFFTESELDQMHVDVIVPNRYDKTAKHLCWYHLTMNGEYTGIAMLLAVESIVDGQEAVNAQLTDSGLTAIIGEYGDEHTDARSKVEAAYILLEKYSYTSKIKFIGDDKLFHYEEWMAKLC